MIYLNNAATTWPKPQSVLNAHAAALAAPPASQFRGGGSGDVEDAAGRCREKLGELLHIRETGRIYFTSGATEALNTLLCGLSLEGKEILTTVTEHNSVLRPLYNQPALAERCRPVFLPCDRYGRVDAERFRAAVTPETGAILVNHCSNVTGAVQDMEAIGRVAAEHGLLFLADVSQSAGSLPVDADGWGLTGLAFAGHKGLLGVQGTGGFYIREGIGLRPLVYGGTGRDSGRLFYRSGEYEYEAGTQNLPGIAALSAGLDFLLEEGVKRIAGRERDLWEILYERLARLPRVKIYGDPEAEHGPVLSFNIDGCSPADAAYILSLSYGITVRAGLHCAPLIHDFIKSAPAGTVRVGLSCFNTQEEVLTLADAVEEIGKACP